MELHENRDRLAELDAVIWAISNDEAERLGKFQEKESLDASLLIDADADVIRSYGIFNPANGGMAHPMTVVIDKNGAVRFVRVDEDYSKRPPVEDVLDALGSMD